MVRVLRAGRNLAIAVWNTLAAPPGYAAVVDLIQRLFGDQAADRLRASFDLGDMMVLNTMLSEAGLLQAKVVTHTSPARFPSVRSWMCTEIKGWSLADVLDDDQFEHLVTAAQQELEQIVTADGSVAFDAPAHIITARKP